MTTRTIRAIATMAAGAALAGGGAQALTIKPTYGTSITHAANAAQIEAGIASAVQFYSTFSNTATVNIVFQTGATGLGSSGTSLYFDSYNSYINSLKSDAAGHASNTVLKSAIASLPSGNVPPIVSDAAYGMSPNRYVVVSSALLRADTGQSSFSVPGAYGLDGVYGHGSYDGVITLSNFVNAQTGDARVAYGATVKSDQYGANAVIQHEVDEVLGGGGGGSTLGDQGATLQSGGLKGVLGVLDLYRYAAPKVASFKVGQTAYFSIDGGKTDIHNFNPDPAVGDDSDWAKSTASGCGGTTVQYVQDYFGCPGRAQFGLTRYSPEVTELEAIGYDLSAASSVGGAGGVGGLPGGGTQGVPETRAWIMLMIGVSLIGTIARRRRALTTA